MQSSLRSMTGFGGGSAENDSISVNVDLRSVNQRGLRLNVRSRPGIGVFEKNVRDLISSRISRGSVDVTIEVIRKNLASQGLVDFSAAASAAQALKDVAAKNEISSEITVRDVMQFPGVMETNTFSQIDEDDWPVIEKALQDALTCFVAMREEEGKSLGDVLLSHMGEVETFRTLAMEQAPLVVERTRERLKQRLEELRDSMTGAEDEKALEREVMFFADRADIAEETDRLESHISQFSQAIEGGGEAGKRLEFLGQEMFREINTIASKANDKDIITASVNAKLAVEKIKEQAANVE